MNELTQKAIERKASEIAWWVNNAGLSFAESCERAKANSVLGPASWEKVEIIAGERCGK